MKTPELKAELLVQIPEFVKCCESDTEIVILHQSAFTAEESDLFGKAVQYAGRCGKEVHILPHARPKQAKRIGLWEREGK